ncbi:MAG: SAVED domain-containing protein [Thermoanaerobaculia bacterium]|nr:SAVED domain-containing protein [Thermoanaerobaculia bacterium]
MTIRQAGVNGFEPWTHDRHYRHQGPLWREREIEREEAEGRGVAVAVGVLTKNLKDVERYVERHLAQRVSKILVVEAEPEPSNTVIVDGNHAFALAQALKVLIEARDTAEQAEDLHLFIASPGAFAFYLGQLSRGFGAMQLYEFDFEASGERNYVPSLRIVPEQGGRR